MYCAQNNRIYCSDCNKPVLPSNYPNHLKSKGHNIYITKKRCCSCDNDINHSNNPDLTSSMNNLSLNSNHNIKTVFLSVKNNLKNEQTKEKIFGNYKNIDPDVLISKFRKLYTGNYCGSESTTETKTMLRELYSVKVITRVEYIFYFDRYIHIHDKFVN